MFDPTKAPNPRKQGVSFKRVRQNYLIYINIRDCRQGLDILKPELDRGRRTNLRLYSHQ
jgi:hypothetical protein